LEEELYADVPIGLFLSGGIDSSLIASLAGSKSDIVSFTASMNSNQYDVLRAVEFSKYLKISHNIVTINSSDVERAFDHLALAFDQPFGDSAAIPMLLMSEYAKKRVGVCLSGDGADELFGGYGWRYSPLSYLHSPNRSSRFFQSVPVPIMRYLSSSRKVNLLSKYAPFFQTMSDVRKYSKHPEGCQSETYFSENYLYGMLNKMTKEEKKLFNFFPGEGLDKSFTFENAMTFDQRFYLPNDILVKTDRASMFHSLEVRSPYLHPSMFNYSLNLRDELKVDGMKTKEILYQMLIQSSGAKLRRPRKMGLGGPLKDWINLNKIQDSIRKSTTNEIIQEAMQFVPSIIRQQIGSKHNQLNWNLAVLQEWISRRF
jgi:asparagine synthase (glutamine-hydrolysing)